MRAADIRKHMNTHYFKTSDNDVIRIKGEAAQRGYWHAVYINRDGTASRIGPFDVHSRSIHHAVPMSTMRGPHPALRRGGRPIDPANLKTPPRPTALERAQASHEDATVLKFRESCGTDSLEQRRHKQFVAQIEDLFRSLPDSKLRIADLGDGRVTLVAKDLQPVLRLLEGVLSQRETIETLEEELAS